MAKAVIIVVYSRCAYPLNWEVESSSSGCPPLIDFPKWVLPAFGRTTSPYVATRRLRDPDCELQLRLRSKEVWLFKRWRKERKGGPHPDAPLVNVAYDTTVSIFIGRPRDKSWLNGTQHCNEWYSSCWSTARLFFYPRLLE